MKFINDRGFKIRRLTLSPTVGLLLSVIMLVVVAVVVISISALLPLSYGQQQNAIDSPAPCITYDSTDKIITITCHSARLTDIDNQIKDANILHKETTGGDHRVWLLNAGIVVAEGAVL